MIRGVYNGTLQFEMEQLIDDIYEIIKDYRQDESMMSKDRIRTWINQFSTDDRVFILEEMKHIFTTTIHLKG